MFTTLAESLSCWKLSTWLYIGACVLLPLVWGIATEMVFRRLVKKRPAPGHDDGFLEYHI